MSNFDYFIILAEMRTGSNFLEANLNLLDGVTCHGEAFNPSFIGTPKTEKLLGIDRFSREKDPHKLLRRIQGSDLLGGFRFFHDHDRRILDSCLQDPHCAKIILTRNPVDSFVSWKIAQATGQWKLTNAVHAKSIKIDFDLAEFQAHRAGQTEFRTEVQRALQITGQTAFQIGYNDLRDLDVINGIAMFLGVDARLGNINKKLKKQNPEPLDQRVRNFDEMQSALRQLDHFDLWHSPHFEPKRGPAIPTYCAAAKTGLLYMPLRSGPDQAVCDWLRTVDTGADIITQFTQRSLRNWRETRQPHRSFAVLRHPVARAHAAFCDRILLQGKTCLTEIRANLRNTHKIPIPEHTPDMTGEDGYDDHAHQTAFLAFLKFLKNNLSGQTSIRVDPTWASQHVLLQGMAQFALPDSILREDELADDLPRIAAKVGITHCPAFTPIAHPYHRHLDAIYTSRVEEAAREAYARDYLIFGFEDWTSGSL